MLEGGPDLKGLFTFVVVWATLNSEPSGIQAESM